MVRKIKAYLYAKWRSFTWLSCFDSANPNVLRGWRRWRWLAQQRRAGILVEPSVRIHGNLDQLAHHFTLGRGTCLDLGAIVWLGSEGETQSSIQLAERVYVGPYAYLGTSGHRLTIGADTLIGAHSYLITVNHSTHRKDISYAQQGYVGGDVIIGKNVWLGCHVTVLPGVTIGDHAIVGAGAVVTKNIPAGETWAGVPARRIRQHEQAEDT